MTKETGKVLIAAPVHKVLTDGLTQLGYQCVFKEQITQELAFELVADCIGIVTSTRLELNKELISAAPLLKWIGRMGSGMEIVDVAFARERGVTCFSSPEGNCNAVGEHAVGMLLSLIRHISWSHTEIAQGIWRRDEHRGVELEGKTVGIIGFGHTGPSFAKKLQGFGVNILVYDKYKRWGKAANITTCESLDPIFDQADIVSFHVPLMDDTNNYFDDRFLERMRKPFILINTSRGQVVNTLSMQKGLKNGKIIGACLDVFEKEPVMAAADPLKDILEEIVRLPNVIATPHIAGYTYEALYKMSKTLFDKILEMTRLQG
jgi:D-3-phosphoglycerate dehydrogenase / 2-oxoglutarate reductase